MNGILLIAGIAMRVACMNMMRTAVLGSQRAQCAGHLSGTATAAVAVIGCLWLAIAGYILYDTIKN